MKGQANIDFIISLVIFLAFVVLLFSSLNQVIITQVPKPDVLVSTEKIVSSKLLEYFSYAGKPNILEQEKLEQVENCSDIDLGITSNFYYEVNTRAKIWSCKPNIDINKNLPYIQRPVYVKLKNGRETPGIMRVWAWGKAT